MDCGEMFNSYILYIWHNENHPHSLVQIACNPKTSHSSTWGWKAVTGVIILDESLLHQTGP